MIEKYLNEFREVYSEISSKLESMLGVSMPEVKFKPMTKMVTDILDYKLKDVELNYEERKIVEKVSGIALSSKFLPYKMNALAVVLNELPKNVYVNTYLPKPLRTKRSIKHIATHELIHVASYQLCPDFFKEVIEKEIELLDSNSPTKWKEIKENELKKSMRMNMFEGIAEYLTTKLIPRVEYSPTLRISNFINNFSDRYKFVRKVCEKEGDKFIIKILENIPSKKEIKSTGLYLEKLLNSPEADLK